MADGQVCAAPGATRRVCECAGDGEVQPAFSAGGYGVDSDGGGAARNRYGEGARATRAGTDCRISAEWPSVLDALKSLQSHRNPTTRRWTPESRVGFALSTRDRFVYTTPTSTSRDPEGGWGVT